MDDEIHGFCTREYPRLVGALALYTGDLPLAEELAQETLTRAIRDWPRLQRVNRRGAYVHRSAINLANSHFRRVAARRRAQQRLEGFAQAGPPGEDADPASAVAVRDALAVLPQRRRAVVVLRFYGGFSINEIADVLSLPVGTVKSQLHRALAQLREVLGDSIEEAQNVHRP